ncbi:bioD [Symbiodinium necroappetens]|uniref:BioD protein n=1 Tax=Symbiodinium necroappetens TaxID=1628268 RepID=A0A812ZWQ3_9DINO|nr:bioD [Symbiodinium necroappetens]
MELHQLSRPTTPGLFVTGTGTEIGKTVVSCLIADQIRRFARPGERVGVLKPVASGCRKERGQLIAEDAEQLAHAADLDAAIGGLDLVTPIRFKPAVAPAMALEMEGKEALDWTPVDLAIKRLDETCDFVVAEGVGGVMVPMEKKPGGTMKGVVTCLDMMKALGWPVVIVADARLGTLNHTALTVQAVRGAGLKIVGVVLNRYDPRSDDESVRRNGEWIRTMCRVKILGLIPESEKAWDVRAIDPVLRDAADVFVYSKAVYLHNVGDDTRHRSKRIRLILRILLGFVAIVAGLAGWYVWEVSTYASRTFRAHAAGFVERLDRSESGLYLLRFDGDWDEIRGTPVKASDEFVRDFYRSVSKARNALCCESTDVRSGFYLTLDPESTTARHSVVLLDDGRLHIAKESADFLGEVPVYSAGDAARAGAE